MPLTLRQATGTECEAFRSRGMRSAGLNVHGSNTVARSLYVGLGYQVTGGRLAR